MSFNVTFKKGRMFNVGFKPTLNIRFLKSDIKVHFSFFPPDIKAHISSSVSTTLKCDNSDNSSDVLKRGSKNAAFFS